MAASALSRIARTAAVALALGLVASAQAATVVPGTSNPKLAGMPVGSTAGAGGERPDAVPTESPVLFTEFTITPGTWLQFTNVSGLVNHCGSGCNIVGADGGGEFTNPSENGISGMTAPIDSLVGVFLGADQPNLTSEPGALPAFNGSTIGFTSLAPALKQVFFIGDGLTGTGSGTVQSFLVPTGATRLYLATHDGYGWYNNSGSFEVTVSAVPEPASIALLLAGLALVGAAARRRRG